MIDFIGKRYLWVFISILMVLASMGIMGFNWVVRGTPFNWGIDFTGGTVVTLRFEKEIAKGIGLNQIRAVLGQFHLEESGIQKVGDKDVSIRTAELPIALRQQIQDALQQKLGRVELLEVDTVGPVIGKELRQQALWALFWASLLIVGYVAVRFELLYALAALLALYHDAFFAAGIIAFLWREVDLPFVAAILTIMGYSINDTIVIFDRVRENIRKLDPRKYSYGEIVNISLNETLARSINTVLTVLVMDLMLLVLGGAPIRTFAITLLAGFAVGAYSSIFLAAPLVVIWKRSKT